jgi:thioredoxin-like negative regulator of GroEL
MPDADTTPPLLVACLCAAWCGTCRDYRPLLEALGRERAEQVEIAWVDIEDHDEVPGPLDIEDFPTLLIARGDEVLFFGTVLPHAQTLKRMVQSALDGDLPPVDDADLDGLPARVRAVPQD